MWIKINILKKQKEIINGRETINYKNYYVNVHCEITDMYATETYQAMQAKLTDVIIFSTIDCKKLRNMYGTLKDYIVEYAGNKYNIYEMRLNQNKNRVLLKCNRIT